VLHSVDAGFERDAGDVAAWFEVEGRTVPVHLECIVSKSPCSEQVSGRQITYFCHERLLVAIVDERGSEALLVTVFELAVEAGRGRHDDLVVVSWCECARYDVEEKPTDTSGQY
jgi:hypothetical protein